MTRFTRDPGDQERGRRSRRPDVKAPAPPNLFDISDSPPDTPLQVKSPTSIDAAKEIKERTMTRRRAQVYQAVRGASQGLARFQIAGVLRLPDHWISSSVEALIQMRKIEEHKTRTVVNPKSGKACAVLIATKSSEMEGAA